MRSISRVILFAVIVTCSIFIVSGIHAEEQMSFAGAELLPPNAKAGECYARVFVPPTYKTVSEMTLKREAAERLIIEEPQFETVEEQVMTKSSSERLEIVPAQFEWQEARVMIAPEHKHLQEVPAVYETVSEKIIDQPAHTVWKKGTGPIQKIDYATGEIMCLVKVPATYKTITKRLLVKPATTREIITPAKYITVRKQVMTSAPYARKVDIPAEFKIVRTQRITSPALVRSQTIPEEFQTVSRRELLTEGRMEWRSVLCQTNTTPDVVFSLQQALSQAGYNPGPIDGDLGMQTMSAVKSYQQAKGLPVGELTIETLRSLGLEF